MNSLPQNSGKSRASEHPDSNDPVKHIYVRDASPNGNREEPLNAFMVPSKYLSPSQLQGKKLPQKKPLGTRRREPVTMYSHIAAPVAMNRIRRPRMTIPIETVSSTRDDLLERMRSFRVRSAAIAAALLAATAGALVSSKDFILRLAHKLNFSRGRITYSAMRGAVVKRFGMPASWFRIAAPAAVLIFLLGLGIFNGLFGSNNQDPSVPEGGRGSGNAVIEVAPSSSNGSGNGQTSQNQAGAPQNGSNPSPDTAPAQTFQGGTAPIGGRGSGTAAPIVVPAPAPTGSTGTITPSQPTPTGGTGGSDGGGSLLPTPSLPLPEVNPGDCVCDTLTGAGEPVTGTLDTTTEKLGL